MLSSVGFSYVMFGSVELSFVRADVLDYVVFSSVVLGYVGSG